MTPPPLAILLMPVLMALCASSLAAQSFEVGGSVSTSCIGSDGSVCSEGGLRTVGPAVSLWLGERVEVGARVVWFELSDLNRTLTGSTTIEVSTTDRERMIAQGEAIWHFRARKRIRPLLGFGVGRYWRRQVRSCTPQGCEAALGPGSRIGSTQASDSDLAVVTGLSVLLTPRLRLRGGWRYHNPFKDELAVSEFFLGLGYRVGRV